MLSYLLSEVSWIGWLAMGIAVILPNNGDMLLLVWGKWDSSANVCNVSWEGHNEPM